MAEASRQDLHSPPFDRKKPSKSLTWTLAAASLAQAIDVRLRTSTIQGIAVATSRLISAWRRCRRNERQVRKEEISFRKSTGNTYVLEAAFAVEQPDNLQEVIKITDD